MNDVPYIVHESTMARMERTQRRQWIVILVLVTLLMGSNIAWLIFESQFEVTETTVTQEAETGTNNYIGNDGDINYGKTDSND